MYLWNIFDILFESAPNDFEFEIYTLLGLKKTDFEVFSQKQWFSK